MNKNSKVEIIVFFNSLFHRNCIYQHHIIKGNDDYILKSKDKIYNSFFVKTIYIVSTEISSLKIFGCQIITDRFKALKNVTVKR